MKDSNCVRQNYIFVINAQIPQDTTTANGEDAKFEKGERDRNHIRVGVMLEASKYFCLNSTPALKE